MIIDHRTARVEVLENVSKICYKVGISIISIILFV